MIKRNYVKIFIIFVILLSTLIFLYFISKSRTFQFFGEIYSKTNTTNKYVALTFDDGPTEQTDTILKILKKYNVKATFFVIGQDIQNYQEETKQIVNDGHELANHSYSHKRMIFKSFSFIKNEIEKTDSLIRKSGYVGDIHFRPPYGKKILLLPYYLHIHNRKTIMFDVEPESYSEIANNTKEITKFIIEHSTSGSIILLHIMRDKTNTKINALENILIGLKQKGYKFKTISELLKEEKI